MHDGTLKYTPKKYIAKMMETYQRHFGELPKEVTSVLPKGDHPELDDSPLCDSDQQAIYLSMVGCMQWLITLGRIDIHYAVTTMSSYRPAPRVGHLERVKRIYGYIRKFKDAAIRVRTEQPDYSQLPTNEHDWLYTVYEGAKELVPNDAPAPLGKEVVTTTYFDANLYANLITGRAMTGIIHLLNKTPLESYSKAQSVVAAATFGSEFIAARLSMEQIYAIRTELRYLGVPVSQRSYAFGDNLSVITQATVPSSTLSKRHFALSYHAVREAIAGGWLSMHFIPGKFNPADVCTKILGYQEFWHLIKPILFWRGDTKDSLKTKGSDSWDGPHAIQRVLSIASRSVALIINNAVGTFTNVISTSNDVPDSHGCHLSAGNGPQATAVSHPVHSGPYSTRGSNRFLGGVNITSNHDWNEESVQSYDNAVHYYGNT